MERFVPLRLFVAYPIRYIIRRTMQKQINSVEATRQSAPSPASAHITWARSISFLLNPAVVSIPLVILVALYHTSDLLPALGYAGLTLFFLSLGPLVYILLGVRLGKLSDLDVSRRTERTGPFLFGLLSVILGLFALLALHAPKNLETVLLISLVSGIVLVVTTWRWKISVHAATLAGALTMLTAFYGIIMLPTFLLLGLVSWSRVFLRRHTLAQVITGSLVSVTLTSAVLLLRGF
jgi:hypothetical protein